MLSDRVVLFRGNLAKEGVEATLREAGVLYISCLTATYMIFHDGLTVDEAVDELQLIAEPEFHPGLAKKYLDLLVDYYKRDGWRFEKEKGWYHPDDAH
jgi:hypothetical protein